MVTYIHMGKQETVLAVSLFLRVNIILRHQLPHCFNVFCFVFFIWSFTNSVDASHTVKYHAQTDRSK